MDLACWARKASMSLRSQWESAVSALVLAATSSSFR